MKTARGWPGHKVHGLISMGAQTENGFIFSPCTHTLPSSPPDTSHKRHGFRVTFIHNYSLIIQNSFSGTKRFSLTEDISPHASGFWTINSSINQKFNITSNSKPLPSPCSWGSWLKAPRKRVRSVWSLSVLALLILSPTHSASSGRTGRKRGRKKQNKIITIGSKVLWFSWSYGCSISCHRPAGCPVLRHGRSQMLATHRAKGSSVNHIGISKLYNSLTWSQIPPEFLLAHPDIWGTWTTDYHCDRKQGPPSWARAVRKACPSSLLSIHVDRIQGAASILQTLGTQAAALTAAPLPALSPQEIPTASGLRILSAGRRYHSPRSHILSDPRVYKLSSFKNILTPFPLHVPGWAWVFHHFLCQPPSCRPPNSWEQFSGSPS